MCVKHVILTLFGLMEGKVKCHHGNSCVVNMSHLAKSILECTLHSPRTQFCFTPIQQVKHCSSLYFLNVRKRLFRLFLVSGCEFESEACWQPTSPTVSLAAVWQLLDVDKAFFFPPLSVKALRWGPGSEV